jgi:molybdenum cofactor cytidylyltransferase
MRIPVIVLAAGAASRFGRPKLLEDLDGRPLLLHALASARDANLGPVILVTGHDADAVQEAAAAHANEVVFNPAHADGMGTSLACGIRACRDDADAALVLLADQPRITGEHLRRLASAWSGAAEDIVATAFAETLGPPVLFGSGAFDALANLEGDRGAKSLLRDNRFRVQTIACDAAAIDIDTEAELDAIRETQ